MIVGLLLRHYKNYGNIKFIPVGENIKNKFSVYIGNNGVGKSAILEAIDSALNNHRVWNTTQGEKKSEAYICPLFLIPKNKVPTNKKNDFEIVSNYFWSDAPEKNPNIVRAAGVSEFLEYRNSLRKYEKTHYLILIGSEYDTPGAYFSSSFDNIIKRMFSDDENEQRERANTLKNHIWNLYTYLYIPVEETPKDLFQLHNETMQKLLNKDVISEIEKILKQKQQQGGGSIIDQINKNLDGFIKEVNNVISGIDRNYEFAPENGIRRNITAKNIREKVIDEFLPLRSLKVGNRRIDLLSSGEQRRAIIDVVYSTLIANGDRKTEKNIILAIDEPETSMHISNCFNQFSRLEELSNKDIQVLVTTHWYGYLPIAQNGSMNYLELEEGSTRITSFNLYNLFEQRGRFPDDVELKSMFDLASSLVSFMRRETNFKWIFCEGSDDKLYLQTMLSSFKDLYIIPLGGCGNVVKLYQILYEFVAEKSEEAKPDALFLIDSDKHRVQVDDSIRYNGNNKSIVLKRLQIEDDEISLLNPNSGGTYEQTEMEDCLIPQIYYNALNLAINDYGSSSLKKIFKKYELDSNKKRSILRGDNSCIKPTDIKFVEKKQDIIEFAEDDKNKYRIAKYYCKFCESQKISHPLADLIEKQLGLIKKNDK